MMRHACACAAVLILTAAACGTKEDAGSPMPNPAKIPNAGEHDSAPALGDPATMFSSDQPGFPEPLAALRFGMTESEIRSAGLAHLVELKSGETSVLSVRYRNTSFAPRMMGGRLYQLIVWVHDTSDVTAALGKAWGPGARIDGDDAPAYVWFNPAAGLRVRAERYGSPKPHTKIELEQYFPLQDLVGKNGVMAFETNPILGSTVEQLAAAYPGQVDQGETPPTLVRPPIEWNYPFLTEIALEVRGARVVGYEFDVFYSLHAPTEQRVVEAFTAARGAPKKRSTSLRFGGKPAIVLTAKPERRAWAVRVREK